MTIKELHIMIDNYLQDLRTVHNQNISPERQEIIHTYMELAYSLGGRDELLRRLGEK